MTCICLPDEISVECPEHAVVAQLIAESFPRPLEPYELDILRAMAGDPPAWIGQPMADTTTGRLEQLARLRSALWQLLVRSIG